MSLIALLSLAVLVSSGIANSKAMAITPEQIQEKNLIVARKQLNQGNVTGAVNNILSILEWEFKEVHPKLAQELESLNTTAMKGGNVTITK